MAREKKRKANKAGCCMGTVGPAFKIYFSHTTLNSAYTDAIYFFF